LTKNENIKFKCVKELSQHYEGVTALADLGGETSFIASGSNDKLIIIWKGINLKYKKII
jgi:WD40 repeat protein